MAIWNLGPPPIPPDPQRYIDQIRAQDIMAWMQQREYEMMRKLLMSQIEHAFFVPSVQSPRKSPRR